MRIQAKHVVIGLVCAAGGVFLLALAGLVTLGILSELQIVPETVCLRGEDVRPADVEWLREEAALSQFDGIFGQAVSMY